MMRWAVYMLIVASVAILLWGMAIQTIMAIKCQNVDWFGFATVITSVTALAGAAITGKWAQKRVEAQYDKDKSNETNCQ